MSSFRHLFSCFILVCFEHSLCATPIANTTSWRKKKKKKKKKEKEKKKKREKNVMCNGLRTSRRFHVDVDDQGCR